MEGDINDVFDEFCDAITGDDVDVAGRLLSEHLGAFISRDLDATRLAVGRLDIRLALQYPAVVVLHPRQHELARMFPGNAPLPPFSLGKRDLPRLKPVYVMTFVREAGRIKLAQRYADQIVDSMAFPTAPRRGGGGSLASAGDEWLTWFQIGRARLAAGELQQAYRDFTTAVGWMPSGAVTTRLTQGYLALVAALMGDTTLARHYLDRAQDGPAGVGTRLWGLYATARAIVEVEEFTPEADEAVAALALIEDPAPLWPFMLLARTRYAELIGREADSLALIDSADLLYSPEIGSFAYDVLVARRVEALIVSARINAARSVYDERAVDAPHCRVALLGLLCSEHDFSALDRELGSVLATPNLTSAQRVQAEAFSALGSFMRDGAVPDYDAPGLGYALSLRAHRRLVMFFPPLLRDALEPYLSADLRDHWHRYLVKNRLWEREPVELLRSLTPRQVAMLHHLDHGRSYAEIAEVEHLSVNTVKSHLKQLYKKLGVSTSAEALTFARQWGLLDPKV